MNKLGLDKFGWAFALILAAGCPPLVDEGDGDGDGTDDPCAAVRCAGGTHCEVTEVQCIQAPCPPLVECVPDGDPALTCAAVLCIEGTTCVETPEGPQCVPQTTCAAVLCIEGTTCVETPEGPQCIPHEENPCNLIDCREGHTCVVENGEGTCIPVEPDACTDFMCEEGQHCELLPTPCAPPEDRFAAPPECEPVPACVDDVEQTPCSVALCPIDTYCDDISGTAQCIPLPSCDGVECESGLVCELVQVECVRAPCPPLPECVKPSHNACDLVRCAAGSHCELVEVVCVTEPCLPVAECVPDGWCGMP
jgi:hypothetical protein